MRLLAHKFSMTPSEWVQFVSYFDLMRSETHLEHARYLTKIGNRKEAIKHIKAIKAKKIDHYPSQPRGNSVVRTNMGNFITGLHHAPPSLGVLLGVTRNRGHDEEMSAKYARDKALKKKSYATLLKISKKFSSPSGLK